MMGKGKLMMTLRVRHVLVWVCALCAAMPLATLAAQIDVGVSQQFDAAMCEAASVFAAQTGHRVAVHRVSVPVGAQDLAKSGGMDVMIPPCDNSTKLYIEKGWVRPETGKPILWRRMAIILPRGDPRGITDLQDILRPDVKVASLTVLRARVEQIAPSLCVDPHDSESTMAMWFRDSDAMLRALEQGWVDAVLAWDTSAAGDPRNFVFVRLPRSAARANAAAPVTAFVTPKSDQPETAQQFVDFLSQSLAAQDIFLKHGYMTDDGVDAASYDNEAAPRFQKVYENICRQLVDDYSITGGRALDIGCGPGQMTLALAGMTDLHVVGLDIEPECITIAERHAAELGLGSRTQFISADAHSLPFPDNHFDLVVSRGTLPFLRDQALAVREVYRVLKPGGVAFLGGGMGRYTPAEEAKALYPRGVAPAAALDWGPGQTRQDSIFPFPVRSLEVLMTRAGIHDYTVINEGGRWVDIRK